MNVLCKQIGSRILTWLTSLITGTPSTLAGFDASGDAAEYTEASYLLKNGSRPIQPTVDSTTAWQMKDQAGNVDFNYDSTNNRFGIGASTPTAHLDIANTSTGEVACKIQGDSGITTDILQIIDGNGVVKSKFSQYGDLYNFSRMYNTDCDIYQGFGVANNRGYFFCSGSATSTRDTGLSRGTANKIYVGNGTVGDSTGTLIAGSIGIGTTSPTKYLDVVHNFINNSGVTNPSSACTAALGAAGVIAGTCYYKISYVDSSGLETGTGAISNGVSALNQKVELTNIPVSSDSTVVSKNIYRTDGGQTYKLYYLDNIANAVTTYTDNTAIRDDATLLGVKAEQSMNMTGGALYLNGTRQISSGANECFAAGTNAFLTGTGQKNTAVGVGALQYNTIGYGNTAIGNDSLFDNTTGYYNTAIGNSCLTNNTSGVLNVAIGFSCLSNCTTSYNNVAIGAYCLESVTTSGGTNNIGIGIYALGSTTGSWNIAIGSSAGYQITSGNNNICIGTDAQGGAGMDNSVLIGNAAGASGDFTTVVGNLAKGGGGTSNTVLGYSAMGNVAGGAPTQQVAIGVSALYTGGGGDNIGIGVSSLYSATSGGTNNVSIGTSALYHVSTGDGNVAIGYNAGEHFGTGIAVTNPSNSIYIGSESNAGSSAPQYEIVIGKGLTGLGDYTTYIGGSTFTALQGKLLIGTVSQLTSGGGLQLVNSLNTNKASIIRGANSQSAVLTEWQDSTGNQLASIGANGQFVFNEQGLDTDCRIEGDTDVNLFYTDAGNNRIGIGTATPGAKLDVNGNIIAGGAVRLKGYTVATLPAGTQGDTAFVTDALAPAYLTAVVGGGAVVTPVFYNGTQWIAY